MGDQPVARPLPIQTQNKHKETSMPLVGFEHTIPDFERAKSVHSLDRAVTVIGIYFQVVVLNSFITGTTLPVPSHGMNKFYLRKLQIPLYIKTEPWKYIGYVKIKP
jgi:hypothetical protein